MKASKVVHYHLKFHKASSQKKTPAEPGTTPNLPAGKASVTRRLRDVLLSIHCRCNPSAALPEEYV